MDIENTRTVLAEIREYCSNVECKNCMFRDPKDEERCMFGNDGEFPEDWKFTEEFKFPKIFK